jgi:hypothetical protein
MKSSFMKLNHMSTFSGKGQLIIIIKVIRMRHQFVEAGDLK